MAGFESAKEQADLDVVDQIKSLFGTTSNAQDMLRVRHIPYQSMNEILRGNPANPEYVDAVTEAWRYWKQIYIRGVRLGVGVDLSTWRLPEDVDARLIELHSLEDTEWRRILKPQGKR